MDGEGDLDQTIALGTWRLPRSRAAAAQMLWRLWEVPEVESGQYPSGDTTMTVLAKTCQLHDSRRE